MYGKFNNHQCGYSEKHQNDYEGVLTDPLSAKQEPERLQLSDIHGGRLHTETQMVREGPAQTIFCLLTAPVDQNMQNNKNKTLYRTKNKVLLTALCYKILLYKIKCQFPVLLFTKIKTYIKQIEIKFK